MAEPDKWHRIGVFMSIASLVAVIAMGVVLNVNLPANWDVVTEHSDRPEQVMKAMDGLESEINARLAALEFARARARRKAEEHKLGITEPGEDKTPAKIAELQARAPEWTKAAERADAILDRLHGTAPVADGLPAEALPAPNHP